MKCKYCNKEIEFDHEELDVNYEYDMTGEIVAHDSIRKVYIHSYSREHLCDDEKTGAYPKNGDII